MSVFWLDDPSILLKKLDFIPNPQMDISERLNALTRLLLLICIILYFMKYEHVLIVLIVGLLIIVSLKKSQREYFTARRGNFIPCNTCCNERGGNSSNTYVNSRYVDPETFSHENKGLYSWIHAKHDVKPYQTPPVYDSVWRNAEPKDYYLIEPIDNCNQDKRPYCTDNQSNFLTSSTEFRDNIYGDYAYQINSKFNYTCPVFKPGRRTF